MILKNPSSVLIIKYKWLNLSNLVLVKSHLLLLLYLQLWFVERLNNILQKIYKKHCVYMHAGIREGFN